MTELISAVVLLAQVAASMQIVKYDPGQMAIPQVVSRLGGARCSASTNAPGRDGAYHCSVSNYIFDPCFASSDGNVMCPTDVVNNKGVVLTKPEIASSANRATANKREPWAMVLASGNYCQVATAVRVEKFPFHCGGDRSLCAAPDTSKSASTYYVRCGRPIADGVDDVTSILVKTAYW